MEEKEKNEDYVALFHKRKRKRHRMILLTLTIIFLLISSIFFYIFSLLNQKSAIYYNESSNVEYGVNLIENEFYKTNYIEENINVISSLIKNIQVRFNYNLNLAEEVEYTYNYKIITSLQLKEKSKTNIIYGNEEEIIKKEPITEQSNKLDITEEIIVDYNFYNSEISNLLNRYELENTESQVSLNMYLEVIDTATGKQINKENNVMNITIPLNTKTVEIEASENVDTSQSEIVLKENLNEKSKYFLIIGIVMLAGGVISLIELIKYNLKTRSSAKMYDDELKKIMFDYKSYIKKINTKIDYSQYSIIKVGSFNELIEMREDIQSPILMYTYKNEKKTIFMMINDNMLFTYLLSADLIKKRLVEESKKNKEEDNNEKN